MWFCFILPGGRGEACLRHPSSSSCKNQSQLGANQPPPPPSQSANLAPPPEPEAIFVFVQTAASVGWSGPVQRPRSVGTRLGPASFCRPGHGAVHHGISALHGTVVDISRAGQNRAGRSSAWSRSPSERVCGFGSPSRRTAGRH